MAKLVGNQKKAKVSNRHRRILSKGVPKVAPTEMRGKRSRSGGRSKLESRVARFVPDCAYTATAGQSIGGTFTFGHYAKATPKRRTKARRTKKA